MKKILEINLEHKDDVIREIEINPKKNLEFLHHSIIDVFGLKKNELIGIKLEAGKKYHY